MTRAFSNRFGVAGAAILAACAIASAQTGDDPLRAIDQGVVDTNPLANSLWQMPMDLRTPTGFERVYEVQTREGQTRFMRVSGGLYATFPRSQYVRTQGGTVALIPADTVFVIGDPGFGEHGQGRQQVSGGLATAQRANTGRLDLRQGSGSGGESRGSYPMRTQVTRPSLRPVIDRIETKAENGVHTASPHPWGDQSERSYRMATLMAQAAATEAVVTHTPELDDDLLDALFGD